MDNVLKPMANGLSLFKEKPHSKPLIVHDLSLEFGKAMSGNQSVKLSHQNEEEYFHLDMEVVNSILIYETKIKTKREDFHVQLYREEPNLTLMFQEHGQSIFEKKDKKLEIAHKNHSLHFFPYFDNNYIVKEDQNVESMFIKLKIEYFRQYLINNLHIGGWFYDQMHKNEPISTAKNLPLTPEIVGLLHQIKNCPYNDFFRELYIDGLVKMLLAHQLNIYNQLFLNKKPVIAKDKINLQDVDKLQDLKIYLDQNFLNVFNLNDLCRKFLLNEFKLKYGFKKMFGTSVMQYVYELRLQYSQKLLLETDKSIEEISEIVGFNYSNNFCASFKKRFQYSPSHFRQMNSLD